MLNITSYELIIDRYYYDRAYPLDAIKKLIDNLESFDLRDCVLSQPLHRHASKEIHVNLAAISQCYFDIYTKEIVASLNGSISSFWDFLKIYFSYCRPVMFLQSIESDIDESDKLVILFFFLVLTDNATYDFTLEFFNFVKLQFQYN